MISCYGDVDSTKPTLYSTPNRLRRDSMTITTTKVTFIRFVSGNDSIRIDRSFADGQYWLGTSALGY
jgi:hypothetical protein